MLLLYHAYVYLEFLILACTIYILAPTSFELLSAAPPDHSEHSEIAGWNDLYKTQFGTRDVIKVSHSRQMAECIPDARLILIKGATHRAIWHRQEFYLYMMIEFLHKAGLWIKNKKLSLYGICKTIAFNLFFIYLWSSGWQDSNLRPIDPKSSALAKLSHTPI